MQVKLKAGYSHQTIAENIAAIQKAGFDRNTAILHAMNKARASYFKRYPTGALPYEISYPKTKRLIKYYAPNGAPLSENPVRELAIPASERKAIANAVNREFNGQGRGLRKAARLYSDFTGHEDVKIGKVKIPPMPKEVLAIGKCDGILYSTVRDGVAEKYIHRFKKNSQPLLTASPDGKQLYLIGGSYNFTDRGIVDK